MNCLHSLEHWDCGFDSHSRHERLCVHLFCVCVVLCVGSGLAIGWSLIQGVLTICVKKITKLKKRPGPNKGLYSHWWMKMNEERSWPPWLGHCNHIATWYQCPCCALMGSSTHLGSLWFVLRITMLPLYKQQSFWMSDKPQYHGMCRNLVYLSITHYDCVILRQDICNIRQICYQGHLQDLEWQLEDLPTNLHINHLTLLSQITLRGYRTEPHHLNISMWCVSFRRVWFFQNT
jgi:hypothetical protein